MLDEPEKSWKFSLVDAIIVELRFIPIEQDFVIETNSFDKSVEYFSNSCIASLMSVDVAEYFTHMPHSDFPDKVKDSANGGKPADSRY